jgi:drug/metabolite transporter (DMT)-like permease
MSWAAGTVLTKKWPVAAPPLAVAAWQLMIGAAVAAPGMLIFEGVPRPHWLRAETAAALAYHVLLAQALAYFLWFEVVARIPAGVASLGTLLVPAFGVLGAMVVLGERPTLADGLGLVLIVGAAASVLLPSGARRGQSSAGR